MQVPNHNPQQKKTTKTRIIWRGFFVRIFILLFLGIVSYAGYFGYKLFQLQSRIVVDSVQQNDGEQEQSLGFMAAAKSLIKNERLSLDGEKDGRINILLLGMGGEGHKGKYLTDTIMLVSIDPLTYESAMFSIPRDLYVKIPDTGGVHTKINAVYTFEKRNEKSSTGESFDSMKKVVKSITGQDVHYYLTLNFEGFTQIIDELGGIEVEVEDDIYDPTYPGPNYSYQTFEISKGHHHLDAQTALKYARVRHTKGGDFGRARRQQQVIASAKRKAFSLKTLANPAKIASLLDTLGENCKTDIQIAEIPSFIHYAKNINIYQTTTKVLDAWSADSLLGSTHVDMGGVQAYVLIPRARNFSQVYELADNIFDHEKTERKREQIENEDSAIVAISQTAQNQYKIRNIFSKLGYRTTIVRSFEGIDCQKDTNQLIGLSEQPKLFTLDDLAAKLDAKVAYQNGSSEKYDIGVCLSDDTVKYFEKQYEKEEDVEDGLRQRAIVTENGSVLYSTDKN